MKKKLSLLILVAVVATSAPAGAGRTCRPPTDWFEGVEGPSTRVTDAATEEKPIEISFTHGPAVGALLVRNLADLKNFPIQVVTKKRLVGLHARLEWGTPSVDEIDLILRSTSGDYLAADDGTNVPLPLDDDDYPEEAGLSGMGYEYIAGYATSTCAPYVVQSEALRSAGRDVTLKLWLGETSD